MNKFKKTAVAVTSVVMAGAMVFSFTGCGGGGSGSSKTLNYDPSNTTWSSTASTGANSLVSTLESTYGLLTRMTNNDSGWQTASSYWTYLSSRTSTSDTTAAGANTYTSDTQINIAIGYQDTKTGAFYGTISGNVPIAGGYTASSGTLKPAVYAMQEALDVKFKDMYTGDKTSANLTNLVTNKTWNKTDGTGVDICTTDLSVAVTQQNTNNNILNLADYLDRMPNFKAFLEENPVVYLSLLQEGMSTSDGSGEEILIAPYFDGNDDIERYCLIRQDWVEDLLDDTLNYEGDSYVEACTNVAASGWMGTTGSYTIETSTESDKGETTFTLKKDYDAALTAAKSSSTALGAAYEAIAGEAYTGTSGNIVDIMNAAINAGGDATGKELATLYRAYIDVAYTNADTGAKAYSTRSDLFNGYSAAWDVDDLVAMLRIVKTNSQNVGLDSYSTEGIFPRDNSNSRTPDIIRLAAQLYGERGADSRYEYTYINNDGELKDMRDNASFYQCLENFGCLASENLVVDYVASDGSLGSVDASTLKGNCTSTKGTGFMEYDYSQTQTTQMFDLDEDSSPDSDYLFAAISTPVSRWDVDDDGTKDTIMRFTESWRSTKTGGLAVSASVASDPNKLSAVLAFIDYLYSNDGQILSTYGMQDTSENGTIANTTDGTKNEDGTWYGNKVSGTTISGNNMYLGENIVATKVGGQFVVTSEYESQYFCFGNELYEGTLYKGKSTPIVTDELYDAFLATSGTAYTTFGNRGSFTGYARSVLGATLPMGVKDQSFENQLTATQAAAEATKVSASLSNGTIQHVTLSIDKNNLWYTTVPTGLPLSSTAQSNIDDSTQASLKYMTGTQISGGSSSFYSIFHYIIFFGYTGSYSQQGVTVRFS